MLSRMLPATRARGWELVAVGGAAALAHAASIPGGFLHWDDDRYVVHNPFVHAPTWEGLARLFTEPYYANFHPVHVASYAVDHALFGMEPRGYHLLNVIFFAAAAVLAAAFLRRAFPGERWPLFAALLFAVHPVHVESVAWISARKDVLALFFGMLYALCHVRAVQAPARRGAALWTAGALLALALGLLSKVMVAPLPLALLAYDRLVARRPWSKTLLAAGPALLLSAGALVLALHAQAGAGAVKEYPGGSLLGGIFTSATVMVRYLGLLVAPHGLSAVYEVEPRAAVDAAVALSGALLLALLVLAVLAWRRKAALPLFALLWFALALAPVSGIVPLAHLMADRYLLFSLLGFAIFVAWGLARVGRRGDGWRKVALAVGGMYAAVCLSASVARSLDWHDDLGLWTDASEKAPGDPVVQVNLGAALADARRYREAAEAFAKALALRPNTPEARRNLARTIRALERQGDGAGAAAARRQLAAAPGP
jgi:hypothetical protein